MKRAVFIAVAFFVLAIMPSASAAEMTLVRSSRPVTAAECTGGAPSGGMVHDFYVTCDTDLLSLATHFNQSVYQHPYGSDSSAPPPELIEYFPAVAADSFLAMPSSTVMLGGGFSESELEKAWGDLSNDGPQTDFLFGRLTTIEPGSFSGDFYLRGHDTYIQLPFDFALPGPSGPLSETLTLSGMEQIQTRSMPAESSSSTVEEMVLTEPRHMKPSRVAELSLWLTNLPALSPPYGIEILASKGTLPRSVAPNEMTASSLTSAPEPTAWIFAIVAAPLLIRLRSRKGSWPLSRVG